MRKISTGIALGAYPGPNTVLSIMSWLREEPLIRILSSKERPRVARV